MLTQAEIREQHAIAERKCADFEEVVSEIVYGFEPGNPSHQMTRDSIIEFVRNRFGELFVGFCRQMPEFIIHWAPMAKPKNIELASGFSMPRTEPPQPAGF
jgi:hypothetical protein